MTSEKVRLDTGTIGGDGDVLSPYRKMETSTLDRQPPDFEDLGIFLSPTSEINEDIIYTLGSFRLDDYIGSPLPSAQTASVYNDLKDIRNVYTKKLKRRYNYWDYIKYIQQIDHTLFKVIEQFVPFRANTKTGLLIEPHFLERSKFKRSLPVRSDAQTMIPGTHANFEVTISSDYDDTKLWSIHPSGAMAFGQRSRTNTQYNGPATQWEPQTYVNYHGMQSHETGSRPARRKDQGTNQTIYVYDDYLDPFRKDKNIENAQACQAPIKPFDPAVGKPKWYDLTTNPTYKSHESDILLGNVMEGKKSRKYYKYKRYSFQSSSFY
jgi:hypothetical protein